MPQFALAGRQPPSDFAQALRMAQLAEQHGDHLRPTAETAGMPFGLMFPNLGLESQMWDELQYLAENAAYSIHGGSLRVVDIGSRWNQTQTTVTPPVPSRYYVSVAETRIWTRVLRDPFRSCIEDYGGPLHHRGPEGALRLFTIHRPGNGRFWAALADCIRGRIQSGRNVYDQPVAPPAGEALGARPTQLSVESEEARSDGCESAGSQTQPGDLHPPSVRQREDLLMEIVRFDGNRRNLHDAELDRFVARFPGL
jgi:hypothetical protein